MKIKVVLRFLIALLILPIAWSQEEPAAESADPSADVGGRPVMPNLFFTKEQRRILEAIRQGVVESETFVSEDFQPLVIIEETLPDEDVVGRERGEDIRINAFIRNRGNGKRFVWANGNLHDLEEDAAFLESEGIVISDDDVGDVVIRGKDEYGNSRFELKVGQVINVDGYIDEELPVVIKKR